MRSTTETYEGYYDAGAASGQSTCGQTVGEECETESGKCAFSRPGGERDYCDTGAASGQSACGQTAGEDDACCAMR